MAGEARIVRTQEGEWRLIAREAVAADLQRAFAPHLEHPLQVPPIPPLTTELNAPSETGLLWKVAGRTQLTPVRNANSWALVRGVPTVTIDGRGIDGQILLREMAAQCGVRNLIFDPGLPAAETTVTFHEVPCPGAFAVVLRSLGWNHSGAGNTYSIGGPR